MKTQTKAQICLSYKDKAEEAARFYTEIIPDSSINRVVRNPMDGKVMVVEFELGGVSMFSLNTGQDWAYSNSVSISIACDSQEEIDRIWSALLEGGKELACGWLTDRYGLAWQIVPAKMSEWISDPDTERAARVMQVMMTMIKLDMEKLRTAYEGN